MKLNISRIGVLLLITLLIMQTLHPITTLAVSEGTEVKENYGLYEVTNSLLLDEEILIEEGTQFFGKKNDDELVEIQYTDITKLLPIDSVQEVEIDEAAPEFYEYDVEINYETVMLNEGEFLFSDIQQELPSITVQSEIELPYYEDDQGELFTLIGNTKFYPEMNEQQEGTDKNEAAEEDVDSKEENLEEEANNTDDNLEEQANNKEDSDEKVISETDESIFENKIDTKEESDRANTSDSDLNSVTRQNSWAGSNATYFKVDIDNLEVYTIGNTRVLGTLKKGQVYPIQSDYGSWHRIQYGDSSAYVHKASTLPDDGTTVRNKNTKYSNQSVAFTSLDSTPVYDNTSGSLVQFATLNNGERYPIATDYGNWWRIVIADRVGYVNKSQVRTNFVGGEDQFRVLKDNLPVYDNRTGELIKVGSLTKGQTYEIVSDYGNWHRINFNNYFGYVWKADTEPASEGEIKNKNRNYKHTKRTFTPLKELSVYDNTSGKLVKFGTLEKGKSYPITSDYGNWWRIVFVDRVGYVNKSDVKMNFIGGESHFKVLTEDLPIYDNRTGKLVEVGSLTKNQTYKIVSDYGNWHRINFNNFYGYVFKADTEPATGNEIKNNNTEYTHSDRSFIPFEDVSVYDNSTGQLVQFGTFEKGKSYPIASDYGNRWRVIFADRVGYINKNEVKVESKPYDKYFRAVKENVEVYDNRTGSLIKVGELEKNQAYPIVSNYGNWWRVQFGEIYGYVQKSKTGYATRNEINNLNHNYSNSNDKIVATDNVIVYDNSGSGALVPFGELEAGTIYPIASDYGNWWRIIYLDRVGYISKADVSNYGIKETEYNLTLEQALSMQLRDTPQTDREYDSYVSKEYIDEDNRVSAGALNVRGGPGTSFWVIGTLSKGNAVEIVNEINGWYQIRFTEKRQWVNASPTDIRYYLNPLNFVNDERQKFQFLDLARSSDASASALNKYLNGKGILSNQGQAFLDASKVHGVNDIYLVSHASLETGHGTSQLANGVEVGKNAQGNLVLVTNANRSSLTDIRTTYNMYGIGAVDSNPLRGGAFRAYNEKWFTPRDAIIGGAGFIGNDYIKAGQNTLYKMRWNPAAMDLRGNARHQYATDIGWASKQVNIMYNLYQQLESYTLYLDIPVYK